MSYRLIDANAIAVKCPEVNDMPCIYADLSCGLDGDYYDVREPSELQRENAELRDLVADLWRLVNLQEPWMYTPTLERIKELGIELGIEV